MQLQGFCIDSHTFACVRHMIVTIFPQSGIVATVQGCIQWYSAVVVPEFQLFLSLLLHVVLDGIISPPKDALLSRKLNSREKISR